MSTEHQKHQTVVEDLAARAGKQVCDTAGQLSAAVSRIGNDVEDGLDAIEEKVVDLKDSISDKGNAYTRATKRFVRKNPWAAAGAAFVLGVFVARKKKM